MVTLFFSCESRGDLRNFSLANHVGLLNRNVTPELGSKIALVGYTPHPAKPDVPEHLPENVRRSFVGAESARLAGLWTEAAASYGKAIDRSISKEIPEDGKRRTLGQKLKWIRDNKNLPHPLIDWISVVLEDRNFAAHDEDRDFESEEEIESTRAFANIFLTYMHTMPERVRIERERQDK
jgi:hypothetical protein